MKTGLGWMCAGLFRRRPDGPPVFHPWGALGHGYQLASEREAAALREVLGLALALTLLALLVLQGLAGPLGALLVLGPWLVLYPLAVVVGRRRWRRVPGALSPGEVRDGTLRALPGGLLGVLLGVVLAVAVAFPFAALAGRVPWADAGMVAAIGALAAAALAALRRRRGVLLAAAGRSDEGTA